MNLVFSCFSGNAQHVGCVHLVHILLPFLLCILQIGWVAWPPHTFSSMRMHRCIHPCSTGDDDDITIVNMFIMHACMHLQHDEQCMYCEFCETCMLQIG